MARKPKGSNVIDAEKVKHLFTQFEELETERLARHSSYMMDMKSLREDKRQVRAAAKDAGIAPAVFDAEIQERAWEKKREARLNAIMQIPDAALVWRALREYYAETVHFIPEHPPEVQTPAPLGPEDEAVDEEQLAR